MIEMLYNIDFFKRKVRKVLRKETRRKSVIQIQFQVQKVKRLCESLSKQSNSKINE